MLLDQIQSDLTGAQKSHDQERVDTLRFLLGALKYLRIEKYPQGDNSSLTPEDVMSVVSKQVKTHKESIEMFQKGGRKDLVDKETAQLAVLQAYMPAQMSEDEVRAKIEEIKKNNPGGDFPTLMKLSMAELKGKADGGTVSKILKEVIG